MKLTKSQIKQFIEEELEKALRGVEEDKKPDEDGDGVPDWADKKPGKDDNEKKQKKLTKSQLEQIIREEIVTLIENLDEERGEVRVNSPGGGTRPGFWGGDDQSVSDPRIQKSWDALYHTWTRMQEFPKTKNEDSFSRAHGLVRNIMLHIENSPGNQEKDAAFMRIAKEALALFNQYNAEDTLIEFVDQTMGVMERALKDGGRIE